MTEVPRAGSGFGSQTTLPYDDSEQNAIGARAVATDGAGNVYAIGRDGGASHLVEWQRTETGFLSQVSLPVISLEGPNGVAADSDGNVFISNGDNNRVVEVQRHSVDFGNVYACAAGATTLTPCSETVTLKYTVTERGTFGVPKILSNGATGGDFSLASGSNCTGTLSVGAICSVNVTFKPQEPGNHHGSVEITDSRGEVLATTAILGETPAVEISSGQLDFGIINFGSTSTLPLDITNTGRKTFTVTPEINGPQYVVSENTCTQVAPGGSCTLHVLFDPLTPATLDETLTVNTHGSGNPVVQLDGSAHGVGITSVKDNPLQFGTILSGTTKTLSLAIADYSVAGTQQVSFSTSDEAYKVLPGSTCETTGVTPTRSCTVQIEFAPATTGEKTGTLTITPSVSASSTIGLAGSAD